MSDIIRIVGGVPMLQPEIANSYKEYLLAKKRAEAYEKEFKAEVRKYMLDNKLTKMEIDGMVFSIRNGSHRKYLSEDDMIADGIDLEKYRYEVVSDPSLTVKVK